MSTVILNEYELYEINGVTYSLRELEAIIDQHRVMFEFVQSERARVVSGGAK